MVLRRKGARGLAGPRLACLMILLGCILLFQFICFLCLCSGCLVSFCFGLLGFLGGLLGLLRCRVVPFLL